MLGGPGMMSIPEETSNWCECHSFCSSGSRLRYWAAVSKRVWLKSPSSAYLFFWDHILNTNETSIWAVGVVHRRTAEGLQDVSQDRCVTGLVL